MTILILLVLICVVWAGVLVPTVWRRYRERQHVDSVDSFHHQLRLLKKTAPSPFASTCSASSRGRRTHDFAAADASRPTLVLLKPTDDARTADVDDSDGRHYKRVGALEHPETLYGSGTGGGLPAYRRELARRRCTLLLSGLVGVAVMAGLIGIESGEQVAWGFAGVSGLFALGVFGLIAYARAVENELRLRRARAWADPGSDAWDDDVTEVRARAAAH